MRTRAAIIATAFLSLSIFITLDLQQPDAAASTPAGVDVNHTVLANAQLQHQLANLPKPAPAPASVMANVPSLETAPTPVVAISDYDHRWDAVAVCEEGGWGNYGFPNFPNSLGINAGSWYSITAQLGLNPSDLSPANQVRVAQAIEGTSYVPDQGYCASW
jgi:hypothetical protein